MYRGEYVDIRYTENVVEIYHNHQRIASHPKFPDYVTNQDLVLRYRQKKATVKENSQSSESEGAFVRGAAYYKRGEHDD